MEKLNERTRNRFKETAEIRATIISILTNAQKSIDAEELKTLVQPKLDELQCSDKGYYGVVGALVRSNLINKSSDGGYIANTGSIVSQSKPNRTKRSPEEKRILKNAKQQLWRALKLRHQGVQLSPAQIKLIEAYENGQDLIPWVIPSKRNGKIQKPNNITIGKRDNILTLLDNEIFELKQQVELSQQKLKFLTGMRENYQKFMKLGYSTK
jgi:hypothetical protein